MSQVGFQSEIKSVHAAAKEINQFSFCTTTVGSVFRDGSRTENGIGSGIFSDNLDIYVYVRLFKTF